MTGSEGNHFDFFAEDISRNLLVSFVEADLPLRSLLEAVECPAEAAKEAFEQLLGDFRLLDFPPLDGIFQGRQDELACVGLGEDTGSSPRGALLGGYVMGGAIGAKEEFPLAGDESPDEGGAVVGGLQGG